MRVSNTKSLVALASAATLASAHPYMHAASNSSGYDYIVVGGGPAGIISAERFVEAGKKVLLIERGTGPTVSTGANDTLAWNDTITPIDLPGLSAHIGYLPEWTEYVCTDTAGYAACVLGGGVTVNYMVFVHPADHDFDDKWPQGWKWEDVAPAADRLYSRNPGTTAPSADGVHYDNVLYDVLSGFFDNLGWSSVDMIDSPNEKHEVYSYPSWNIDEQKRAGPVRTYLPLVQDEPNFTLKLQTKVNRLLRNGPHVYGVEIENADGSMENVTIAQDGRVVLAAGALSTPRVLFNSGIGPAGAILNASASGVTVPPQSQWIGLPVGAGIKDHPIFSIVVNTNETFGLPDYDAIVNGSATTDIEMYEEQNSGLLTEGKHRLIFFTSMEGEDGQLRYYQGSCAPTAEGVVTMTSYMTHGLTSEGVLTLDTEGNTVFEESPYLQTEGDVQAATAFIDMMVEAITAEGTGFELETYLNTTAILNSLSSGIHFAGSAKLGTDDGRFANGTSVVDLNTKVYGTDNLVCDSSALAYITVKLELIIGIVHRRLLYPP